MMKANNNNKHRTCTYTPTALHDTFFEETSKLEILKEKCKHTLFAVLNILLKFDEDTFIGEVLSLINETCQFLYYPFYDPMNYLWKSDHLFNVFSSSFSYFQTVVFFNDTKLYIVVFYVVILLIVLLVIDVIYVAYIISSKNKSGAVWPMRLLRSVVSFIVTVMFNPMVEFLLAILECSDKDEHGNQLGYYQNYNVDDMHCWTNTHFTVMVALSIISTIVFVIICTVVQMIFYETKTSDKITGAKTNSNADLVSLAVKIALIMIYSFLVWDKHLHWIVVSLTLFCGFIQFYVYWIERPFYEEYMNTAFLIHTGIFFWSTVVLFALKVLEHAQFNGGVYVFIIGTPIVVCIIITQRDHRFNLLMQNINKFQNGGAVLKQIRYFLELVDNKYKDRKSNILLKGYIYLHEDYCTLAECPLKKYLKETERCEKSVNMNMNMNTNVNCTQTGYCMESVNNLHTSGPVLTAMGGAGTTLLNSGNLSSSLGNVHNEADVFLMQYAMSMYQNGISKFPSCTSLRMSYAFFLMERMNNSKKSLIELKNCEKYAPSFEEEFIIYRFTQNNKSQSTANDAAIAVDDNYSDDDADNEDLDIISNIAYRNYYNTFKGCLISVTDIYMEFWSLLLNHSHTSEDDLAKMNDYGEKINKLIAEIKRNYTEMEKLKYNDEEVLVLYSDFFEDILNDKSQAEIYRKRLLDIQGNTTLLRDSGGVFNDKREMTGLPHLDEFEYIFLSAEGANIGTIIKASLGICVMFGYSQNDLVGKHIDFIMPDMYQELHKQLLNIKLNKYKTIMNSNMKNNGVKTSMRGTTTYKEIFAFGKNKLKHAVPFAMKVTLMYTQDQSELFFASKIMNDDLYNDIHMKLPSPGVPPIINFNMKVCYVLTDLDFIIQYYTPNAIKFLGLKSNSSGNMDITKSISDFNNNEERYDLTKMTKSEIYKEKYFEPKLIIWKTALTEEEEEPVFHIESTTDKLNIKRLANYSRKLVLNGDSSVNDVNNVNGRKGHIPLKRQRNKEDYFMLGVSEVNILGQGVGYVFRFELTDLEENEVDCFDDKEFFNNGNTPSSSKKHCKVAGEVHCVEINPMYIPEINKKFDLDTRMLAFVPQDIINNINNSSESSEDDGGDGKDTQMDWHMKLRTYANEKINRFKAQILAQKNKSVISENSSEDDDDSDNDNDNGDSSEGSGSSSCEDDNSNSNSKVNNDSENAFNSSANVHSSSILSIINSQNDNQFNIQLTNDNNNNNTSTSHASTLNPLLLLSDRDSSLTKLNSLNLLEKKKHLQTHINNTVYDYYHVACISDIKFSIYDFKQRRLIDIPCIKRESQVEYKKTEICSKIHSTLQNKFDNTNDNSLNYYNNNTKGSNAINSNNNNNDNQSNPVIIRQIEYALRKEEFQPEIIKIRWISIITVLTLTTISIVLFYLILSNIKDTKENFHIISDLHALISNIITGIYYIRELTLLYNHSYRTTLYDKDFSKRNITSSLNDLFIYSYKLQQHILTTNMNLHHNRKNLLLEGSTTVHAIKDDLTVISIDLSINAAITQLFTSMYIIANDNVNTNLPLNNFYFFYLHNDYIPVIESLRINMNSFMREYKDNIMYFTKQHFVIFIIICVVLVVSGVSIKIMYDKIISRKGSYLEVFFEIDDNVCKKALTKCDNYAKVLRPVSGNELDSDDDDDEVNDIANGVSRSHKKHQQKHNNERRVVSKQKHLTIDNSKNILFIIGIIAVYSVYVVYFLGVVLSFHSALGNMETYSKMYNITAFKSHIYLSVFDKLREYFFDYNMPYDYSTFTLNQDEINNVLGNIHKYQKNENVIFNVNKLPSSYKKVYHQLHKNNLCNYTGDLFINSYNDNYLINNKFDCSLFTGNSSDYGIDVLVSYYIEQCRNQKYNYDQLVLEYYHKGYTFNNTLYGTHLENETNSVRFDNALHPFQIFNNVDVLRLSVIRMYYIRPVFDYALTQFHEAITKYWNDVNAIYTVVMIIMLIGIVLFYLIVWRPFENKLNQDVYKTKNMLSIIPKEVLASLRNINNILNIRTVNSRRN